VRALAPAAANRTYNLVGTEDVTIRQIAGGARRGRRRRDRPRADQGLRGRAGEQRARRRGAGLAATTPFAEGLRRYVAWHRAAPPSVRRRRRSRRVARRAALSLLWAAATALMIIGVATWRRSTRTSIAATTFFATLVVALRSCSRAASTDAGGERLRASLWAAAGGWLVIAILPWPNALDHVGHGTR
jgi:hypothetical protein